MSPRAGMTTQLRPLRELESRQPVPCPPSTKRNSDTNLATPAAPAPGRPLEPRVALPSGCHTACCWCHKSTVTSLGGRLRVGHSSREWPCLRLRHWLLLAVRASRHALLAWRTSPPRLVTRPLAIPPGGAPASRGPGLTTASWRLRELERTHQSVQPQIDCPRFPCSMLDVRCWTFDVLLAWLIAEQISAHGALPQNPAGEDDPPRTPPCKKGRCAPAGGTPARVPGFLQTSSLNAGHHHSAPPRA